MVLKLPDRLSQRFRHLPLQIVIIFPFVFQILATIGLVGYFSYDSGSQVIDAPIHTPAMGWVAAIAILLVTGILTTRWVIYPVLRLDKAVKGIAQGEQPGENSTPGTDEVRDLAESLSQMAQQLHLPVSDLQTLSQALAASKDHLSQVLESLPIGVFVSDCDRKRACMNQTGQIMLGVAPIATLPLEEISATCRFYRAGTDQLYPTEQLPINQALQGKAVYADDIEVHREEQVIALEVRATPVFDHQGQIVCAIATFQDISTRRQAQIALHQNEARFRRLTENAPGVIYRYVKQADGSGQFTYISPRCRSLYEIEPEAVVQDADALWSLCYSVDAAAIREVIKIALETLQPWSLEYRIVTPSGCLKWVQNFATPDQQSDQEVCWDGFIIDITDRKQIEKLQAEYNQTLEQQVQQRTLSLQQEIGERQKIEDALRQANLELERLVTLDGLTQVANRRHFDAYLAQEWKRLTREQQPLSLILCDVDYFKRYNDHYGHQQGDDCLQQVANIMSQVVRRPADLIARYGGEEFAVILPNTDAQGTIAVAQAIQVEMRRFHLPHARSSVSAHITLSIGIASMIPSRYAPSKILITRADEALYTAKHQGRDRIILADEPPASEHSAHLSPYSDVLRSLTTAAADDETDPWRSPSE